MTIRRDEALSDDERVIEIAPDVYLALDDGGKFEESKHPRDNSGKFAETAGGGVSKELDDALNSLAEITGAEKKEFKTKKEHIGHLLTKGTTAKEVMTAMGWPSVSMPNQAKSLGMKLEKYQEGGVTKYKGVPLTDKEKAALKAEEKATKAGKETDAQAKQILKNAGLDVPVKPAAKEPSTAPKDYEEFKQHLKSYQGKNETENIKNLMKYNPAYAAKYIGEVEQAEKDKAAAEKPKLTDEQVKKAGKGTPASLSTLPGDKPTISGSPQMKGVEAQIKAFNDKYAGKQLSDTKELAKKVDAYKNLMAYANKAGAEEKAAASEAIKKAQAEAKANSDKIAAKAKEEAARSAEKNKKVMADLGISEQQATAVTELAKMMGSKTGDIVSQFKNYEPQLAELDLPITGFQAALIKNYTNGGYTSINKALRGDNWTPAQHAYVALPTRR